MNNPLLYVSKPKVEIKQASNKQRSLIDNKVISQLDELYRLGRSVLCEFKINGKIHSGFFKMENNQVYLVDDGNEIKIDLSQVQEVNVLKI